MHYTSVIAKSNRIRGLLCRGSSNPNDSIRGVKFTGEMPCIKHVFTYYVGLDTIKESLTRLIAVKEILECDYHGKISHEDIEKLNNDKGIFQHSARLAKTKFVNVVVDVFYIQKFSVDFAEAGDDEEAIVTLYRTDVKTEDVFRAIGIDYLNAKQIDENTVLLRPDEIALLRENAPYLIAMKVRDLREVPVEESVVGDSCIVQIPAPKQEPVIGVIDTPFCEDVYFKDWVSYESMLEDDIELDARDYVHGTEVTSIIVDGPTINPNLDDGCGRFRVKHFGVAKSGRFSSYTILKSIRKAVSQNRDIKVWNLSLGSVLPIKKNFISPEAAELDKIQNEFDIVFVVAGTNGAPSQNPIQIGAPADSLNSLVVNSVTHEKKPASYHRVGPVLSFFTSRMLATMVEILVSLCVYVHQQARDL